MKTKNKATVMQYNYMVTGLLSAKVQRGEPITQDDVKDAVSTAKTAYDMIYEILGESDEEEAADQATKNEPMPNYFQDYGWKDGKSTWSELCEHIRTRGIRSNRRISAIFKESIEKGYIRKDAKSRFYLPPLP